MQEFKLIDSHCHIDFPELATRIEDVLQRMEQNNVSLALCASVSMKSYPGMLNLVQNHVQFLASVGVHPDSHEDNEITLDELLNLAKHHKVVAIGETGLDYYRLTGDLEWQRARFRTHIQAANEARKPLIIHTREAACDTLKIMQDERADKAQGVMHCFTESKEVAKAALDMGFYISISGIVTFKNAHQVREVARYVPIDRLLIETDSPYLAPVPHRGKTNEPGFVRHVAEEIAKLRDMDLAILADATTNNFNRLFRH